MIDVADWLRGLGLAQYAERFAANDIDADVLPDLSEADLQSLGVSLGHRRKLLKAIAALASNRAEAAAAGSGTRDVVASREDAPEIALPERRHMTVMFCDLVGSTALAERLDLEDYRVVVRRYQSACAEVVARLDGTVAKYLGDGILAYFGYPHAHEDDAERAVRAGLDVVRAATTLDNGLGKPLQVRIGIATGLVVVGDVVGEGPSREQAVVGETPNLAARLQAIAAPDSVVIAEGTRDLLGQQFSYESLGPRALAGITDAVQVWRVTGEQATETRFGATHGGQLTRLVGRDHEIDLLLERWGRAVSGEGQVVLLGGVAGIGKSRIVATLRERLGRGDVGVVQYQCSPHYLTSPLHPVIRQLSLAAGFTAEDSADERLARLGRLVAGAGVPDDAVHLLALLLSVEPPAGGKPLGLTPQEQKQRTIELLALLFEGLTAQRPALLVLEDAHWVDPTTRELMDALVERAAGLRALVLVTHRPEFHASWASHAHATVLVLNRLGRSACQLVVADLAKGRDVPPEVFEHIVKRSDGVPLFVEELTKAVLESGLLREEAQRYVLEGALTELAIPSTLHDSLMARLDRLQGGKEIAQIGAAIGREFSYPLLEAVSAIDATRLGELLGLLRDSDIVFQRGTPPAATYVFKHALIQDAAYESMLRNHRRQIHARIAAAIETRLPAVAANEPEVLADHLTRAGAFAQAAPTWLRAGQRALSRSANQEAIAHLTAGLDAMARSPAGADAAGLELDIQVGLGSAWIAVRGYSATETEAAYTRARALLDQVGDDPRRCSVLHGLAMGYINRANPARTLELGEDIVRSGERLGDRLFLLVGHRVLAVGLNFMGRFGDARQHAECAVAAYDEREHHDTATRFGHDMGVGTWWHLAIACLFLGDRAASRRAAEKAAMRARELNNATTLLYSALWDAFTHLAAGDSDAAATIAREMIEQSSRRSMALWTAYGRLLYGSALADADRFDEALHELQQGTGDAARLNNSMLKLMALRFEASALAGLGQLHEGLTVTDEACRHMDLTGERWWEPEVHRVRGEILARMSGTLAAGAEDFRRALAVATQQGSSIFESRAAARVAEIDGAGPD